MERAHRIKSHFAFGGKSPKDVLSPQERPQREKLTKSQYPSDFSVSPWDSTKLLRKSSSKSERLQAAFNLLSSWDCTVNSRHTLCCGVSNARCATCKTLARIAPLWSRGSILIRVWFVVAPFGKQQQLAFQRFFLQGKYGKKAKQCRRNPLSACGGNGIGVARNKGRKEQTGAKWEIPLPSEFREWLNWINFANGCPENCNAAGRCALRSGASIV